MTPRIRTYHEVDEIESSLPGQVAEAEGRVGARLASVERIVGVMSGKGGVGKSLMSAAIAASLARAGRRVGLLDADLNGPSAARMLGISAPLREDEACGVEPARSASGVRLMSMALLLDHDAALRWKDPVDAGFVWRGVQEREAVRQFFADVDWGALDVLIVDLPPGTQRLAELHGLVPDLDGAVAVTLPGRASVDAVARPLDIARSRGLPLLGLVENMSGLACDECGALTPLYEAEGGVDLAARFDVELIARLPFDRRLAAAADKGAIDEWLEGGGRLAEEIARIASRVAPGGERP